MPSQRSDAPGAESPSAPAYARTLLFALFVASGFSGLIYESVWSHYLKLVLGHAAYAQTLVLAIFMGGMAVGAALSGRYGARIANLLFAYALVEACIGVIGLGFHSVFGVFVQVIYDVLIPGVGNPTAISVLKFVGAGLLILPQSVLLGATFPLMSVGVIRLFPSLQGATLSSLYFTNSLGAAIGVLVSGFVLIPSVGLPGTILTAALLNLAVAVVVGATSRKWRPALPVTPLALTPSAAAPVVTPLLSLVLMASLVTGLASFFYEIGWIRMLSLVLGTTNQAFELMLSAFITGLALGSLYVRRRIGSLQEPLRFAGYVQLLMAACALLTIVIYNGTFDVMAMLMRGLAKNDVGYTLFHLASHSLALCVMLPATFMAGMTLPLFTFVLLRERHAESSVARVYAANTVGAIGGVLLAVHVVMPHFGTKGVIGTGALLDGLLGVVLLHHASAARARGHEARLAAVAVLGMFVLAVWGIEFDPRRVAAGVYRNGQARLSADEDVTFYRDGKTATIAVVESKGAYISIKTNGKADAMVDLRSPIGGMDEATMKLAAAVPLSLLPAARTAAVIGFGSGMTTHTLLGAARLTSVDTIEIEQAILDGARRFGSYNVRAFEDSRSHIHVDDAKTFFSSHQSHYDVIISEPSNPWVSGIASLFSEEFYRDIRRHLRPHGLLVQWLQLYDMNLDNTASVFKALGSEFADYAVFNSNDADLLIVASVAGPVPPLDDWVFAEPGMAADLTHVRVLSVGDLEARKLGTRATLGPLFEASDVPANSDFFPVLADRAVRSRYLGENAVSALTNLHVAPVPVLEALLDQPPAQQPWTLTPTFKPTLRQRYARALFRKVTGEVIPEADAPLPESTQLTSTYVLAALRDCSDQPFDPKQFAGAVHELACNTNALLPADLAGAMWTSLRAQACYARLPEGLRQWMGLYHAVGNRDYAAMADLAGVVLARGDVAASDPRHDYAVTAGLLGRLRTKGVQGALAFLGRHAPDQALGPSTPPELRLLLSLLSHQLHPR